MSDIHHQIEGMLADYRQASPEKNLNFLASQVQARLLREEQKKGFSASIFTTVCGSLQLRFAAIGVALMMGSSFGLMAAPSSIPQKEFAAFSHQYNYLPATRLSQYE